MAAGAATVLVVIIFVLFSPVLLRVAWRRAQRGAGLVMREDFELTPDGDLLTDRGRFIMAERVLVLPEAAGERRVPFEDIAGYYLRVMNSLKVQNGVILKDDSEIPLGIITNYDLKQAGINGHLMSEMVAGAGEGFLAHFRAHEWSPTRLGETYTYRFA